MTYTYKGETFTSIKALADFTGIKYGTLKCRMELGISVEEAIEAPLRTRFKKTDRNPIFYQGKEYAGLMVLAKTFGINRETLKGRIRGGMSVEEAIETPIGGISSKGKEITINGKKFYSLVSAAKYHQITASTLSNRIKNNLPLIKKPKRQKSVLAKKPVTLKTLLFRNIRSIIVYYNPPRASKVRELLIAEEFTVEVILGEILLMLKRTDSLNENLTLKDITGIKKFHLPTIISE